MKTGLVMEGGAMRGMFTCGVIDVFMENGIEFDGAVGVSAGAAFGCNIKSKQIGRAIRYNQKYAGDPQYAGMKTFLRTGDLYNVKFCYEDIPDRLDPWDKATFDSNPMEFFVVATDVDTGESYYYNCKDGSDAALLWIRASASIPAVSKPVEINGHKYLDGGMSDPIPLEFMEKQGYERIVVIETQPLDFIKRKQKFLPLIKLGLLKYPAMRKTMSRRHIHYNEEKKYIRDREKDPNVFVIRPSKPLNVGGFPKSGEELWPVYQAGREAGLEALKSEKFNALFKSV